MHSWNWSDLRYVLTVAREGSAAAAARVLMVNHSTVVRRVRAFEARSGVRVVASALVKSLRAKRALFEEVQPQEPADAAAGG